MRNWILGLPVALVVPTTASAMSCDDILELVGADLPADTIVSAVNGSGSSFTADDVACVKKGGAPASVVSAVSAMVPAAAAPAAAAAAADAPAESRFDSATGVGAGLTDGDDAVVVGDSAANAKFEAALDKLKAGKVLTASKAFFDLIDSGALPEREAEVNYRMGQALEKGGFVHAAQHYYMQVVRKGPQDPVFKYALPRLARVAEKTDNDYELLRIVSKIPPETFPRAARPHLYYLLGRKAYDAGELADAAAAFDQVPENHELYPRSQYYLGNINYERGKYKSAVAAFTAVTQSMPPLTTEQQVDDLDELKNMSVMNIARVYFKVQNLEMADKLYGAVDRASVQWPESVFERAWTTFHTQDLNQTLGLLLTVESSWYRETEFIPETTYLKALTYFNLCDFPEVERLMANFAVEYTPMRDELKEFLKRFRSKEGRPAFELAFEEYFEQGGDSALPKSLFTRVLRKRDLKAMVKALDRMDVEEGRIAEQNAVWRESVGEHLQKIIEADRQRYKVRAGKVFLNALVEQYKMVDGLLKDGEILRFEVANAQMADYEFRMKNVDVESLDDSKVDFAVSKEIIYWPFNGEFWLNELGYYRYAEQSSCN